MPSQSSRVTTIGFCSVLAVSLLGMFPSQASAQTPPPSPPPAAPPLAVPTITAEVVVTANATPMPGGAVGRTVTVISRDELERFGVSSVIDGLRLLAGVTPKARGGHEVQTDFSLRGATFGQSLILLDGARLNDSQSGHHNGEIPAPLVGIDRIEVVFGPASAVHGADAMGGTIQVITRTDPHVAAQVTAGEHGLAIVQASTSGGPLPTGWTLSGWGSRSAGFMFDRDFSSGGGALRGALTQAVTLDVRHQRRAFGANGFYGNSPSKEWTDQTLGSVRWAKTGTRWTTSARVDGRNHGDHFRWDIRRPGFAENRHRTNALDASLQASSQLSDQWRVTAGGGGGRDWIASSNLGDRTYGRGHGYLEAQWTPAARLSAQVGARFDAYSTFGRAVSPSAAIAGWLSSSVRMRASAARAFRIPTFTERFYSDPAHQASATLAAEHGTALDGGVDVIRRGWTLSLSPFIRWDEDVIDWIRASPAERWRTTNVRDVTTSGAEVSVARQFGSSFVRAHYAGLRVDAPSLMMLSKYVLEFARHTAGLSAVVPVGEGVTASATGTYRDQVDGQSYWLVDARINRRLGHQGRVDAFVEGRNLLNTSYREVAGVPMAGRWMSVGLRLR